MANDGANLEENPAATPCPLCCEDAELVLLNACSHKSCRACLAKWIEKEESSGQDAVACPFCRVNLNDKDVYSLIGRQFQRRESSVNEQSSDEIDELTLEWINSQTKMCPGCGYRVEKDDGCNHMECLCGYEFCFGCGQSRCSCEYNGAGDFDNDEYYAIRNNAGEVMFDACIRRTTVRRQREYLRENLQREVEVRWTRLESTTCVSSGEWIYSPKKTYDSFWALYGRLNVTKRESKRQRFYEEQMRRWDWDKFQGLVCTSNGRWLFCSRNSSRMLGQLLRKSMVRAQREIRLENQTREAEAAFNVWRALNRREVVRQMRNARREELEMEYLTRP
eukprot:CAMPEP_0183725608 /NCGR_PEP_ID=MMETSP0737-20130205/20950_1 /TAXON_ID=385413 /ORGANISM="Thalassiosira miniscula, Strain CCMP1093" /LENGTH=334 /DNA_ID=CAMNT_0025956651 /DNA_START=44 /DNA_END=1048 /DNA_ORIENTATION=+